MSMINANGNVILPGWRQIRMEALLGPMGMFSVEQARILLQFSKIFGQLICLSRQGYVQIRYKRAGLLFVVNVAVDGEVIPA